MITTSSTLSYERQTVPPIIPAVQGDTGRNISFTISDYEIPEGASAAFYIQKPSGEAIYNTAEIVSSNVVNVPLDAQCLAEAGENFGQVRILLDDEVITSFSFILLVKVFHGVDAIESLSEMNVFDQAVADAAADFQTEAEQIAAEVIESIPEDYTALSNDVTGLKQDLEGLVSFNAVGAISTVISNVKVFGSGTIKYAITNINNNFNGFTGVVIYTVSGSTFTSSATVSLSETQGHKVVAVGREAVEFDYNLNNIESGTRITVTDDTAIIKDSNYVTDSSYATTCVVARIFSNVRILAPKTTTYYLGYASRNDSIAVAQIYSSENSYAKINNINIGIGKGHVSEQIADGSWITFDYDMSWTDSGVNYGNYVNAQTQIKSSCVTKLIDSTIKLSDYASVGMFESMGVLGDSYASGWVYRTDDTENPYRCWEQSWIQVLAREVGNTATNFSFGGLTTRTWLTHAYGKAKLESESAKQIYFLCLGINDVNALGMEYIGSGDDYNNDADTFVGNYSHIIRIVQTHAPNARLIMFTTPFTSNETYVAYNNAIIAIANHFAIPCIQQHLDTYIKSTAFQNGLQSGHPNAVMYSEMATAYKKMIAQAMIDNPNYFKNFTGSGSNT